MNTTPIDIIAWFAYLLSAVMFVMSSLHEFPEDGA